MPRILVIESDHDVLLFLVRLLRRTGYDVITTNNPAEAPALARACQPQAILIDISHPTVAALAPRRVAQASPELANVPLIAMISRNDLDESGARALGYAGWVAKPFHIRDLLDQLAMLAEASRANGR